MASFWQLSGPGSHLKRDWKDGKHANATIAENIFSALSMKCENGSDGLEFILGIESSGASQILVPSHWRQHCRHLNWGFSDAYPSSRFASLSPMQIETPLRLQMLLEERQKVSKGTKASKQKGDTSKANGRYWDGPPNPSRAAFEHSRCLWRIIQNDFQPELYGLPEAPWLRHAVIFSLAVNFWAPDGIQFTTRLIDASLTKHVTDSSNDSKVTEMGPTWYFVAKENAGLQNSFQAEGVVQETWNTRTMLQDEIGVQIQALFDVHSQHPSTPLILLVHDYVKVKQHLAALGGVANTEWAIGVVELLGFHRDGRHFKREGYSPSSRGRSFSPRGAGSGYVSIKRENPPSPQRLHESVFVVDTVEMFKTVTAAGVHSGHIRPVTIFNAIFGRDEQDSWCAGDDSRYILQSWEKMVQGPSIDEQKTFFAEHTGSSTWLANDEPSDIPQGTDLEVAEAPNLHEVERPAHPDPFNDDASGSDSESDEQWHSVTVTNA